MIERTRHQIIEHEGIPVAAVVPYDDYQHFLDLLADETGEDILTDEEYQAVVNDKETIPHDVVVATCIKGQSPIKAWREHLNLTQEEVAERMGIKQPAFARMESGKVKPRLSTIKKIAKALGITHRQLDITDDE